MLLLNGQLALSVYYTSWSIYARQFEVNQLPYNQLSHVNYAFAGVNATGHVALTDPWADVQRPTVPNQPAGSLLGNLGALYNLKQQNPHLKVGLSIGGWGGSAGFSPTAANDSTRATFAQTALDLMLQMGLDYVDLDWEYPVSGGADGTPHNPEDGRNYVLLLQELRSLFTQAQNDGRWRGSQRPGISLALPCGQFTGRFDYLKEMGDIVDFANMMCYDFAGAWSPVSDRHSNLYSRHSGTISADAGIKELLAAGFPARKVILGMPLYGRGFEGCSGLTDPFTGPSTGTWGEPGVIDYKALNLRSGTCEPMIEIATNGTYCHDNSVNRVLVYDSVTAVQKKMDYVKELGLAGVMFWESSADLYADPRDSLIAAAFTALSPDFSIDSTPNNLCYPDSPYPNINSSKYCKNKSGSRVPTFVPTPISPVNMEKVSKAVPFGSRIHKKLDEQEN